MTKATALPKFFARKASGFRREFSAMDTFIFNTVGFALGLVLATFPTFLGGLYPNANVFVVLTLGTILTICNGLVYGFFSGTRAMAQSGGDYLFVGRTFNHAWGFVANWGFSWSQFLGVGVYTAWCVRDALSPALSTLGYVLSSPALISLGTTVAKPSLIFVIGTGLLFSVLVLSLAGLHMMKRFINSLFFVALAGTFAMMIVLLTSSHEQFVSVFNSFMATHGNLPDAYARIIALAQENGFQPGQPADFKSAILALPVGYWAFIGFTYSVYVGGEVKEPQRSQVIGIIGSLLFGFVMYVVILGAYYSVVGRDFNNAVAVVQGLKNNPLPTSGSMTLCAGLLTKSAPVNILLSLSTFLWFYLLLFVMATVCVRNIFAWSYYGTVPVFLSKQSKRSGSPWVATLVIILIAEVFLAIQAFLGLAFMNYIALFSVCFLIAGIAAIVLPYRRPELFRDLPGVARRCVLGLPLIVIAGIGNTVLFVIVLYSALTNPGLSGTQSGALPTYIVLGIYVAGFLTYLIARRVRVRQNINLDLAMSEIPEE